MGNCIDKGDGNSGADGKGAQGFAGLMGEGNTTFETKNDTGRVHLAIDGEARTFTLNEYEGDATDARTAWTGAIRDADNVWTFDASADGATESETKTFTGTLNENGSISLGHKFVGDIEELARQGEAAEASPPAEAEGTA